MSFVKTGYRIFSKLKEIFKRKSFKAIFIAFSSSILFFGVMNVFAQEAEIPKLKVGWEGTKALFNLASGTERDEDNMTSFSGVSTTNALWVAAVAAVPKMTAGAEEIENDSSIPEDMKNGLLGTADNFVTYAYTNQPNVNLVAHLGSEWVPGYKESTTGLYAAEKQSGYDELMDSGISNIWAKFRDLAYLFFVVVMIVIGFMIMFRSKLGGQTLVSLGNTIPNVIIGLILVTFSFAIAGLIIDIGGLITNFLASLFTGKLASIEDVWHLMKSVFGNSDILKTGSIAAGSFSLAGAFISGLGTVTTLGIVSALGPISAGIGLIGLLFLLVLIGIVFVGIVKLLITLYKAYFGILLGVALGPIQIMVGTIPGQNHMTKNWLLGILRNVLVFPVVFFIVNVPNLLLGDGEINLSLPEKLTFADPADSVTNLPVTTGIVLFVLRVFVIYLAAQAPKYIDAFIPNTSSKAAGDAGAAAKMSLSKIPLVGGLFK